MKKFYYFSLECKNVLLEAESLEDAQEKLKGSYPVIIASLAEVLEEYKGRTIAKCEDSIIVLTEDTRFIVGLDDSKEEGKREFIEEANDISSAKEYIDWLTK